MPPRAAPGNRGGPRGGGTGGGRPPRGGAPARTAGPGRGGMAVGPALVPAASHVKTIGVRRPGYGQAGRPLDVQVNCFPATAPGEPIHHYDVVIEPSNLPARVNLEIIKTLQHEVAPQIFTPKAGYDGRKNIFAATRLNLKDDAEEFIVPLAQANGGPNPARAPKIYKVKLALVSKINPEVLARFILGQQSHDNEAITAITACNVALRMAPNLNYPFNTRSFFIEQLENRHIGHGIELWRGLFQSFRPGIERMFVNVDIATGMMYKRGTLLELCLDVLEGPSNPNALSPNHGLPDDRRIKVSRFISGVHVVVKTTGGKKRLVRGLTRQSANDIRFDNNGTTMTVAQYFHQQLGRPLQYPNIICAEVGKNAIVPLEVCVVPPGQIIRKQIPSHKTTDVLAFATKKPQDRFELIRRGTQYLQYGQSEYIRALGINVDISQGPLEVSARTLMPPKIFYGKGSRELTVTPRYGAWNMIDKLVWRPCDPIKQWGVIIYEREQRFPMQRARDTLSSFADVARKMGIIFNSPPALIRHHVASAADVSTHMMQMGRDINKVKGEGPSLFVVILPEGGDEMYTAVKHFGDIQRGVATQCLKASKCGNARPQYWANVLLKINVKLGGINSIVDPQSSSSLSDPANPTCVMGADVMHPAPGADGKPSFTAVVASMDQHATKYIATDNVQTGREEIIIDLKEMVKHCLSNYIEYRRQVEKRPNAHPRRLLFFRDGVSEGQFTHVLSRELPLIKEAMAELGIKDCKITLVVVGKRHHIRMNAKEGDRDKSGNAPAGTVIDRVIGHPTEFDFYLLSHGGLLGTSRPSHYSVLYDEFGFTADTMQGISYSLCHAYARATRSVSIPAPVYYADTVCARAKTHYDPTGRQMLSDTATQSSGVADQMMENFKRNFKPLSAYAQKNMYFS